MEEEEAIFQKIKVIFFNLNFFNLKKLGRGGSGENWKRIHLGLIGVGCHVLMKSGSAIAASKNDKDEAEEMSNKIAATAIPFLVQLGFSGLIGFCCACTLKIAGKAVAIGVGLCYLLLQVI